jgi:hypothetical protein
MWNLWRVEFEKNGIFGQKMTKNQYFPPKKIEEHVEARNFCEDFMT